MAERRFWLASNSPRRHEILGWLDWEIKKAPADIDETRLPEEKALDYVMRVSFEKARRDIRGALDSDVVIAADTIVVLGEEILGKPRDQEDARDMLERLRGRPHAVLTAISVKGGSRILQDICRSPVVMRKYSDAEIGEYVASGDPMDKAGAYAIQNEAFDPVQDFQGCFASVMGMPLCHLERTLKKCGIFEPGGFAASCQNHLKYTCPITNRVMGGENIG